ncbi:MAG: arginase [Microgenomates group bacterium]
MIDLYGVPLDLGSERMGCDMGPNGLRYQMFVQNLRNAGLELNDLGNLACPSPEESVQGEHATKYLDPIVQVCKDLAHKTEKSARSGNQIIVLGGDHSLAVGSIAGAVQGLTGSVGVIWIDAHGDLNTPQTTPSGNVHGMPFAAILGYSDEKLTSVSTQKPMISLANAVGIGFKDLDPGEDAFVKEKGLQAFFINDILAHGLSPVFSAIDSLATRVDHLWVSFDLDAIDLQEAPGVGMPNKGGLTYREIHAICAYIGKHYSIAGLDLVEYNPVNDIDHKTAILATELTAKLFGKDYSRYSQYLSDHAIQE